MKEALSQVEQISHKPISMNYANYKLITHPAQNNLYPLDEEEKRKIIKGFKNRPTINNPKNYYEWLVTGFGTYFTDNYPCLYTKKYWCFYANQLSTTWCGERMHLPSIEEVEFGAKNKVTPNVYYAKEMFYPKNGGFGSFFKLIDYKNVRLNEEVKEIDCNNKCVKTNLNVYKYNKLITSLPLNQITGFVKDCPENIINESKKLVATSMANVSVGFNRVVDIPSLWFYIYDKDIPFARAYSPSLKSPYNVPSGKSSLQFEHYYVGEDEYTDTKLMKSVKEFLLKSNIAKEDDISFIKVSRERYANVVFLIDMEKHRDIILNYLNKNDVVSIGRFGKWEYLWSDQAYMSGKIAASKLKMIK